MSSSAARYSRVAMTLHWVTAICILSMIPMGLWMTRAIAEPGQQAIAYQAYQLHKSVGFLILALTVLRVAWGLVHKPPAMPEGAKKWETFAAKAVHAAFYALMIGLPLTGWLYVSTGWAASQDRALVVATSWFGMFPVPHIPGVSHLAAGARRAIAFQSMSAHAWLAWGTVALVLLHVGAALKHQFIDRDGILARMVPGLKLPFEDRLSSPARTRWTERGAGLALIVIIGAGGAMAGRPYPQAADAVSAGSVEAVPEAIVDAPFAPGTASAWAVDPSSTIGFSGAHAGKDFKGAFQEWEAKIWFDPADLAGSRALVTVQTASARTGDATQENTLGEEEWFGTAHYPAARYEATGFRALGGDRFEATGTLRIKTTTIPVVLPFTYRETNGIAKVNGTLELDRIALNMGVASDATAEWVTRTIAVKIDVTARKSAP